MTVIESCKLLLIASHLAVVDGNDFKLVAALHQIAERQTANTAKTIYTYFNRHTYLTIN